MSRPILVLLAVLAVSGISGPAAAAETCFHACLKGKLISPDIDDQTIREYMQTCKESCDDEMQTRLEKEGLEKKLAACIPEKVPDADMKKVRSASPSVVAFANAFTWDVKNVLPGNLFIRKIELSTQNVSLEDVTLTATGIVEPGEIETFLMNNISDGYPSLRVTTRVQAIYACSLDTAATPTPNKHSEAN
jgi:hypothetical protein